MHAHTYTHRLPSVIFAISSARVHYKERLVELINHYGCDPAVLFTGAEIRAELQRWGVAVPTRQQDEAEALYGRRLQMVSGGMVIIVIILSRSHSRQVNYCLTCWQ